MYESYPEACQDIKTDFYMDDFLGSANTKQEALQLRDNLRKIMCKGSFELRKWISNDCELLKDLHNAKNESMTVLELE